MTTEFNECNKPSLDLDVRKLDPHEDHRGWVEEVYSGELGADLQNIHLGSMEPKVTRGNHRHPNSSEWITFLNGTITITSEVDEEVVAVDEDSPLEVTIPEDIPHAFTNNCNETIYFVAYRNVNYEDDPDTQDHVLTEESTS